MQFFDIPEHAIGAFEKLHGLRVTVHDLRGSLWPFLLQDRWYHVLPHCQAVKARGGDLACVDFEIKRLRQELPRQPHGRMHVCHAGLVEWAVPVFRGNALEWVLFAGLRTPAASLRNVVRDRASAWKTKPWPTSLALPTPVDNEKGELILEHLRQLAARLWVWAGEMERLEPASSGVQAGKALPSDALATRRTVIQCFIQRHHTTPVSLADLARALNLGESRASHVVRESCGSTFKQLLIDARLRTAMGLLRHSTLSVLEIAVRSGFDEVAHFHRLFRRHAGTTPARYRRRAQS
jgi:AraC-like DNA-binding protein